MVSSAQFMYARCCGQTQGVESRTRRRRSSHSASFVRITKLHKQSSLNRFVLLIERPKSPKQGEKVARSIQRDEFLEAFLPLLKR
jgi:hypothetical protein